MVVWCSDLPPSMTTFNIRTRPWSASVIAFFRSLSAGRGLKGEWTLESNTEEQKDTAFVQFMLFHLRFPSGDSWHSLTSPLLVLKQASIHLSFSLSNALYTTVLLGYVAILLYMALVTCEDVPEN